MSGFREKKNILYIANALSNKKYIKNNIENVAEWIVNEGGNFSKYQLAAGQDETTKNDFLDFYKKNKLKALKKVTGYAGSLRKKYALTPKSKPDILEQNLYFLQALFALSDDERKLLDFMIRSSCDNRLEDILSDLQSRHSDFSPEEKAIFAGTRPETVYKFCFKNSYLVNLGLMEIEYNGNIDITDLAKTFYFQKFRSADDIKTHILGKPLKAGLKWQNFKHIQGIETLKKILTGALKNNAKGINILLYGEPGTGKTEFAKTLAENVRGNLYAIGENETSVLAEDNRNSRYNQLTRADILLKKDKNTCLLVDEADDILTSCSLSSLFCGTRDDEISKIKVNRLLENNLKPTIWISNNIHIMDKAYLRRFTYALKFTCPTKDVIEDMWQKSLKENNLPCDKNMAKTFACKYTLSPSFINTATKTAKLVKGSILEVEQTLDALQEAYNNGKKAGNNTTAPEQDFNPGLLNTDTDLALLAKRLHRLGKLNFSLCLYGVSGTGKSAFAQYLGKQMGLSVIKEKCSDLLGMYVGESEQNIANAFERARQQNAMLIFDEADSFLQDRNRAQRSWEITLVNEMLTQMENHPYPFVCTTNLIDKLDKASLRRFTFKVKYDYLTPRQSSAAFEYFFDIPNVDLSHLNSLAPGDFVVVRQKAEILGLLDNREELIKMLEAEQLNKAPVSRKIGFI